MDTYSQRGGLRWGASFWRASNATWPFATLQATAMTLDIFVGIGPLGRSFAFSRLEVERVALRRGLISTGLEVSHGRSDYPPFILFWTFQPGRLLAELSQLGWPAGNA